MSDPDVVFVGLQEKNFDVVTAFEGGWVLPLQYTLTRYADVIGTVQSQLVVLVSSGPTLLRTSRVEPETLSPPPRKRLGAPLSLLAFELRLCWWRPGRGGRFVREATCAA